MSTYTDYRFRFPIGGLAVALTVLSALRDAKVLGATVMPQNMLGDPRDDTGNVVVPSDAVSPAWIGRPGAAATSYIDPNTGETVELPAHGDSDFYYVAIRSEVAELPIDPSSYGMIATAPDESAAVLGVWA